LYIRVYVEYFYSDGTVKYDEVLMPQIGGASKEILYSSSQGYNVSR